MPSFSREELHILSTLAYYQALGVPSLTVMEILRYWTPWGDKAEELKAPSFLGTIKHIDALAQRGVLQTKNGYVALPGKLDFFDRRIEAKKQGIKKRRIYFRFASFLPYLPYVRIVALTGSLATDNANEESDIDILVGSEAGRIWTTRILVTILFQVLGKRRHGIQIKDRICLNHYVALDPSPIRTATTKSFSLLPQALTTAHIYAQAVPLWGTETFRTAQTTNPWLRSYIALPFGSSLPTIYCVPNRAGLLIKNSLEACLAPLWNVVEKWGGSLQKKHILNKLAGKSVEPLEILVGDNTLLFHYPFSRSKYALARYYQLMQSITTR